MGWTKRELIGQAFTEIGLAPNLFNVAPDDIASALRTLDAMLATWNGKGIRLGYPLPSSPGASDPDEDANLPDLANEAVYLNLALRIAPGFGKTVSPDTKLAAKQAFDVVALSVAFPPEQSLRSLPKGAGNHPYRNGTFFPEPGPDVDAGNDTELEF